MLMAPKANRLLETETQFLPPNGADPPERIVKQKKNIRRLGEILRGGPEEADFWIV